MNTNIIVIVLGRDNSNTLGLVRQYGPYNVDLHVVLWGRVIKSLSCVIHSKYCKKYHYESTLDGAMDYIEKEFENSSNKPFIVPSGDLPAEAIDQKRERLMTHFIVPGTSQQGMLTKVLDKNVMCHMAEDCGFVVPKSLEIKGGTTNLRNMHYPCLIKPIRHGLYSKTNFKTKVCKDRNELLRFVSSLNEDQIFQVQEYVKKEEELLIYGYRLANGACKTFGVLHRLRGGEDSDTTFGYIENEVPEYVDLKLINVFLNRIDFTGIFSFEYGVSNGMSYFFEVNLRNDATAYWFFLAGANIPMLWVHETLGLSTEDIPRLINSKQYFIDEFEDLRYVRHGEITKERHVLDMKKATLFKYKNKNDSSPYYRKLLEQKIRVLYNWFRKSILILNVVCNKMKDSKLQIYRGGVGTVVKQTISQPKSGNNTLTKQPFNYDTCIHERRAA